MQDNDLIGRVVYSKAGRDKKKSYIIIDQIDDSYVLVADGSIKTTEKPKKKKLKHVDITTEIASDIRKMIIDKNKSLNSEIKKFLKLKGIVKEV